MPPREELPPNGGEDDEGDPSSQALVSIDDMPPEDAIALLVTSMQDSPENTTIVEMALLGLLNLFQEHGHLVQASDATEQVFRVLQNHSNRERLVELSLFFLLRTIRISAETEHRTPVYDTEKIALMASVMSLYPDNVEDIQPHGALVLIKCAQQENSRSAFMETNAVAALLFAMEKLSNEPSIQCAGCVAISNLLENDESGSMRDKIEQAGGVALLVNYLKCNGSHPASEESTDPRDPGYLLGVVCESISLMARDRDTVKKSIVEMDGISALLSTIKHQISNDRLEYVAFKCLRFLVDNVERTQAFIDAGGVNTLATLLNEHPENELIVRHICMAVGDLAENNTPMVDALALEGGLAAVIEVMHRYVKNMEVMVFAGGAIGICARAEGAEHAQDIIRSYRSIPNCIVAAMQQHVDHLQFQGAGLTVLRDLGYSVLMCANIVQSGALPVIVSAMNRFQQDVDIQEVAIGAVGNIAEAEVVAKSANVDVHGDMIQSIYDSGAVTALLGVLCRFSKNDLLVDITIPCLRMMAEANECVKNQLTSIGVLKLLASIQNKAKGDTAVQAGLLLECLEKKNKVSKA